jgi:mRNA-degrading endonuclease toxin of MazEF toxin-antitoxin module
VTAFEDLERGDIVWGTDPLSEKGRPMLVLGTPRFPDHGVELLTALISTQAYHTESIPLRNEDYTTDPLGKRSHVLPWSLATLNSPAEVELHLTSLVDDRVEDVAMRTIGYISS